MVWCVLVSVFQVPEIIFFFKQMSSLFVVLPLFCPQKGHVSRCTGRGSIMPCSVSVFVLCSCVCVHACVCMGVCVRACAAQPASSANAPWKTNSVSVDSISRQRSSSDPPAVHPPLPPLRVTSTSTFFFPFTFLAVGLHTTWMAGGEEGVGPLGRHVGSKPQPARCWGLPRGRLPAAPSSLAAGRCLSHSPRGPPPLSSVSKHSSSVSFPRTSVPGFLWLFHASGYRLVFLWIRICSVFPFSVMCPPGGGAGGARRGWGVATGPGR